MKQTLALVLVLLLGVAGCYSGEQRQKARRQPLPLRVMTYNIYGGGQKRPAITWDGGQRTALENRLERLTAVIRDLHPDVLILQELQDWDESNFQILSEFGQALGMLGVMTSHLDAYHVGILSRYPVSTVQLLPKDSPFRHNLLVVGVTLPDDRELLVGSVHFAWSKTPGWEQADELRRSELYQFQCDTFLSTLKEYKNVPFVLGGDLNLGPRQAFFGQPPLYEQIRELGYVDVVEQHNPYRYDQLVTHASGQMRDYLFVSSVSKGSTRNAGIGTTTAAYEASDHLPVWADLVVR